MNLVDMTRKEAAEQLGVSLTTIDRYRRQGLLRDSTRHVRVSISSVRQVALNPPKPGPVPRNE